MIGAQSWFRIGKYDTKSTSTGYACNNAASWILSIFKVIEVDFISISIDRIGPRLEGTFTIYRKIRYAMRVPMPKYRFLSIGLALRKSHFLSPSWNSSTFHVFDLYFWFLFVCRVYCLLSRVSSFASCILSPVSCFLSPTPCPLSLHVLIKYSRVSTPPIVGNALLYKGLVGMREA